MADSKKVKQKECPTGKAVRQANSSHYYDEHPSWNFCSCDTGAWSFSDSKTKDLFWGEIFPRLQEFERQTWSDILILAKKSNHAIEPEALNKVARDRLDALRIEAQSIISLRFNGTHRMYGFMEGAVFHILWYDLYHGDNLTCVCRSKLKHT